MYMKGKLPMKKKVILLVLTGCIFLMGGCTSNEKETAEKEEISAEEAELEKNYEGKGYGDFKKDLVEVTCQTLAPIRARFDEIRYSDELIQILKDGAQKADAIAQKTMKRVKENFGLGL